jgi:hypothetical protein
MPLLLGNFLPAGYEMLFDLVSVGMLINRIALALLFFILLWDICVKDNSSAPATSGGTGRLA